MEGRPPEALSLLSFSRELRRIDDYDRLIELVRDEVERRLGLTNAWLYVFEREEDEHCVLVAAAGSKAAVIREALRLLPAPAIGEAISKMEFDLHVLDAVMPGLSGRETCERIRAARPAARFLFTSGYGGDALPASFLSDLGIEIISKPFDPEALLRTVRAIIDRKSS